MIKNDCKVKDSRVLVLGITFKENCPDIRNSRVIDVINEFREFGCAVEIYDPWAKNDDVEHEYGLNLVNELNLHAYDLIVLAVAHNEFKELNLDRHLVYKIKNI